MPAAAIIAGGAVIGGIAQGIGSANVAKTQTKALDAQRAQAQANYAQTQGYYQNDLASGNAATSRIDDLLGLSGRDVDVGAILAAVPGNQYATQQALNAVNSNAWAAGGGQSGAAMKALQSRGAQLANQQFGTYLGQVNSVADRGSAAKAALAQAGQAFTNQSNQLVQQTADVKSNNQAFQAANIGNIIKGVVGAAGSSNLFNSSYAPQGAAQSVFNNVTNATRAMPSWSPIMNFSTPNLSGR